MAAGIVCFTDHGYFQLKFFHSICFINMWFESIRASRGFSQSMAAKSCKKAAF